jgi:Na+-translocating ferredoxin:NAD+ oxidoreductase RNF subunit RnfB
LGPAKRSRNSAIFEAAAPVKSNSHFTGKKSFRIGVEIMALSIVDLYRRVLPKTNCGDCGHPTCLAFASMVVSEKLALNLCPHIDPATRDAVLQELEDQYAAGKWTRRDPAGDALQWARERAASMTMPDLQERIGGRLCESTEGPMLELPYFTGTVCIRPKSNCCSMKPS